MTTNASQKGTVMAARNDEKRSAEQYRLLQTTALLKLYRQAHGVPAPTPDAVQAWVTAGGLRDENLRARAIDPFTVLTDEEIDEIVKGAH